MENGDNGFFLACNARNPAVFALADFLRGKHKWITAGAEMPKDPVLIFY